ncbi:MAG: hypothetical protein ACRDV2_14140 [Actinomycetes bacterium]
MSLSSVQSPPILASGRERVNVVLRYVVTVVCAGSASVHATLVPAHLDKGGLPLGLAFAGSAVALTADALTVRTPRHDSWAPASAGAVLALVAAAYVLSRTVGIPLLVPEPERLETLGALTTGTEVVGAVAAVMLTTGRNKT